MIAAWRESVFPEELTSWKVDHQPGQAPLPREFEQHKLDGFLKKKIESKHMRLYGQGGVG